MEWLKFIGNKKDVRKAASSLKQSNRLSVSQRGKELIVKYKKYRGYRGSVGYKVAFDFAHEKHLLFTQGGFFHGRKMKTTY